MDIERNTEFYLDMIRQISLAEPDHPKIKVHMNKIVDLREEEALRAQDEITAQQEVEHAHARAEYVETRGKERVKKWEQRLIDAQRNLADVQTDMARGKKRTIVEADRLAKAEKYLGKVRTVLREARRDSIIFERKIKEEVFEYRDMTSDQIAEQEPDQSRFRLRLTAKHRLSRVQCVFLSTILS